MVMPLSLTLVIKIASVTEDGLDFLQSLRTGKMNLSYNGNDVAWHPMESRLGF
jgi:hypothetical protein